MINDMTVSVVMATFNGEPYIKKQIDSILSQLDKNDELVISDDGSDDNTIRIIKEYQAFDDRIRLLQGPRKGFVKNFEFLFGQARNEIVVISDQDDVWREGKVAFIRKTFKEKDIFVILHDAKFIDEVGNEIKGTLFAERNTRNGFVRNLVKSGYYGCCMAVKRAFLQELLPFPEYTDAYDQCIGIVSELEKKSYLCEEPLIWHRIHSKNESKKRDICFRIRFRYRLVRFIIFQMKRKGNAVSQNSQT